MSDDEVPLTTRGVPRTRFDPLRDAPRAGKADLTPEERYQVKYGDSPIGDSDDYDELVRMRDDLAIPASEALIQAVRRQIAALGLSASVEGNAAIVAAEKAAAATGSAAAACLHQLRIAMNEIRTSKPVGEVEDATEDVLSRRRERKAGG